MSYHACQLADAQRNCIPIGKPVANTQLHILDSAMQPVPVGCEGDLYIAGVQLSSGYYQREQLNAELFLQWPMDADTEQATQRIYKTGDLARWNQCGEIEYLGRSDFQVKIRGQRIELGEIDAILLQQAGVQSAASLIDTSRASPIIIAFIVLEEKGLATAPDLPSIESRVRHALVDDLPMHMVPTAFVLLPNCRSRVMANWIENIYYNIMPLKQQRLVRTQTDKWKLIPLFCRIYCNRGKRF